MTGPRLRQHDRVLQSRPEDGPGPGPGSGRPRAARRVDPVQLVAGAFAVTIAVGTGLLMLPSSSAAAGGATFLQALFTATSAVCVTGLAVVDTGSHWSGSGQAVVLVLVQLGGLGIMTATSVVTLLLFRRLGLRSRLLAQTEAGLPELGGVQTLVRRVVVLALAVEAAVALALAARFAVLGDSAGTAAWRGVFHSVMAFNHAGFALFSDSFASRALDEWLTVPLMVAIVVASLGFPCCSRSRASGAARAPGACTAG